MMGRLVAEHIRKSFENHQVLSDFCYIFEAGTTTCIEGPSGCGKTTLLRILAGFEAPDSGIVEKGNASISFVFQEDRLSENFSALSNIRMITGKRLPDAVISEHLSKVGISEYIKKPVCEFSGGMKRRVAIVRAVCYDADIVLMDEPFKGLDTDMKTNVMDYVKRYCKDKTLIFVTHDRFEAEYMGGNIISLEKSAE